MDNDTGLAILGELRRIHDVQTEMMEFLKSIFLEEGEEETVPEPCLHKKYGFAERGTSLVKVCADCGAALVNA